MYFYFRVTDNFSDTQIIYFFFFKSDIRNSFIFQFVKENRN